MALHIPCLANIYCVAVNVIGIFAKQKDSDTKIRTIRTKKAVLALTMTLVFSLEKQQDRIPTTTAINLVITWGLQI